MRLSAVERRAVESATRETVPAGARVLLLGSRVDDKRRGGDIASLVGLPGPLSAHEHPDQPELRFAALKAAIAAAGELVAAYRHWRQRLEPE